MTNKSKKYYRPWYTCLNLRISICIMTVVHLIILYFFCNGVPITLMNIIWVSQGFRPLPL